MAINLTNGEEYTLAKIAGTAAVIDGTDHAHATKTFRNSVDVVGTFTVFDSNEDNDQICKIEDSNDDGTLRLYRGGTGVGVHLDGNGTSYFYGDAGNTVGGLAVGKSTAARMLEVEEDDDDDFISLFRNSDTGNNSSCLRLRIDNTTPASTNKYLQFDKSGGSGMNAIEGDGAGNVRFTGNAAGTYSDMRNKQNIVYLDENYKAGDILRQIDVLEYELKSDARPIKLRHMGFSAQQMLKLYPYPVSTFEDENKENNSKPGDHDFLYHKLNQGEMTPLIVKTIQEMMITIDTLKARIEVLENA